MQGGLAACSMQSWWWCDLWGWQRAALWVMPASKLTDLQWWLKAGPHAPLKSRRIFFLLSGRL
jgi:hypothetical protein